MCLGYTLSSVFRRTEPINSRLMTCRSEVVLQAQCAYWPTITASSDPVKPDAKSPRRPLSPVPEYDGAESDCESSETLTSMDDSFDSSTSTLLPASTDHVLHLPIIPLPLPSPETFPLLLVHLHTPNRSFVPRLLGLSSKLTDRRDIVAELEKSTLPDLMSRLALIHAVWKNVCVLGIGYERIWREMAGAWGCVIVVVAGVGGGRAGGEGKGMKAARGTG